MSYDNGANSYLVKPVSFDGFLSVVSRIDDYWLDIERARTDGEPVTAMRLEPQPSRVDDFRLRLSWVLALQVRLADKGLVASARMKLITDAACDLTRASAAAIHTVVDTRISSDIAMNSGDIPKNAIETVRVLAESALLTGNALICNDTSSDPRVARPAAGGCDIRSVMVVPIRHSGEVVGCLGFYASRQFNFSDEDLHVASLLAAAAGSQIRHGGPDQSLRASEARFRGLIELSSDWYWELDANGCFVQFSGRMTERFGIRRAEVLGRHYGDLAWMRIARMTVSSSTTPSSPTAIPEHGIHHPGAPTRRAPCGAERTADFRFKRLCWIPGVGRDVTRRFETATRLTATTRFARRTLDALTKHICVLDETGAIIAVNRAWREFGLANGARHEDVIEGGNYLATCEVAQGAGAEDAARFARVARAILAGTAQQFGMEYPCHSPEAQGWFQVRVSRFDSMTAGSPRRYA